MKKFLLVSISICAINAFNTQAQEIKKTNRQQIVITKVVDGDTVDATLLEEKKNVRIRLADIDCPETGKKNAKFYQQLKDLQLSESELKEHGKKVKEKLKALIELNSDNIYFEETPEKVCKGEQRSVGILWTGEDKNINDYLLTKAGCKPYSCREK